MKPKARKYWLVLHSRASEEISAERKHDQFFGGLANLSAPWGLAGRLAPSRPSFGRSSSAIVSLTKFFGTGVNRASVTYPYRRMLGDSSLSDDLLSITLDPEKVDAKYLLYTVIPTYIVAFNAYLIEYFDDVMIDAAWDDPAGRVDVDIRQSVGRINVASFYDEILCRRAFDLSPAEVVDRVAGRVEHSRLVGDGAYLIVTSKALPTDQTRVQCGEVFAALTSSR